jgi:hypothetical protein
MRSSTTGFGSWPGATAPVSGLLPATEMTSPSGFRLPRRPWQRFRVALP